MKIHVCATRLVLATVVSFCLFAAPAQAQSFKVIYSFTGANDGGVVSSGVVLDAAGNIYGTTTYGGSNGAGVIYKIDAAGHETILYNFTLPYFHRPSEGDLILDAAGNLYGATFSGNPRKMWGMVYELDVNGTFTPLYSFKPNPDGKYPYAGLSRDDSGNLYGTTLYGGTSRAGVVFKIDAAGNETILHDFTGRADGGMPFGDVIRDSAGNLYGTASLGGSGFGTLFKIDAAGQFSILHTFTGGAQGGHPYAGVIRDSAGNLYGVTSNAGDRPHHGVVFMLDSSGQYTVLHNFDQGGGRHPVGGLARDAAGNLYGTCFNGGTSTFGTIFMVTSTGKFKVLYNFNNFNGARFLKAPYNPQGRVTLDGSGNLYGTTTYGGANEYGTVFRISPNH